MKRSHRVLCCVFVISALIAIPRASAVDFPPVRANRPIDRSSPQKVAAEYRRAFGSGNWQRGFRTITPESQDTLIGMELLSAFFVTPEEGKDRIRLRELLEDYEIPESKLGSVPGVARGFRGEFNRIVDKPRLFGKLVEFTVRVARKTPGSNRDFAAGVRARTFSNFHANGSNATADVTVNGRKLASKLYITRTNGRWYVDKVKGYRNSIPGANAFQQIEHLMKDGKEMAASLERSRKEFKAVREAAERDRKRLEEEIRKLLKSRKR